MKIQISVSTLIITIVCLLSLQSNASHIAGISMRYDYVGNDPNVSGNYLYKITKSTYRHCSGINLNCGINQDRIYLECSATGAKLGPVYLQRTWYRPKAGERLNANGARDISPVCSSRQTRCQSPTGVYGYEEYFSEAVVSLPRCQVWRVYGTICQTGGNSGYANFNGTAGLAAEVYINTNWSPTSSINRAPANSGAHLYNDDRPFINVCVGQKAAFAAGGFDNEGDSLTYESICPLTTSGGTSAYTHLLPRMGFTCSKPIPGFNLDSLSGLMTFTPTMVGTYLVGYYISEYEQCTGILKGRTYREIVFNVGTCTNNLPLATNDIGNIKGRATILAWDHIEACEGDLISWEDTLSDPDISDSIHIKSNIAEVFPGGTMKLVKLSSSRVVARYSCKAMKGTNGHKFIYTGINDDNCDFPGIIDHMMHIEVIPSAHVTYNEKVCAGDTMLLSAGGGEKYVWSSISGDSIKPGINWFPQDTFNRVIKFIPTQTSVLSVFSNSVKTCGGVVQNCFNTDTFTITTAPSFSSRITPDTSICNGNEVQFKAVVSPSNGKYKFRWTPSSLFKNDSIRTPLSFGLRKNQTIYFQVTSDSGCTQFDSVQVKVSNPFPKNMSIEASRSVICLSDTIDLGLNFGSINYGGCGLNNASCLGSTAYKTVGVGAINTQTGSATTPDLYSGKNRSTKTQYLYKAADLKARGMSAGPISSIAFEISQLSSQGAYPFNGFTIKMGCTNKNDLVLLFIDSLHTVFNPKTIIPVHGSNRYVFDEEYVWDGIENIVVEVIWDNGATAYNDDHIMAFDAVSYSSANQFYSISQGIARSSVAGSTSPNTLLPKTEFGVCEGINKSNFTYSWSSLPNSASSGILGAFNKDSIKVASNLSTASQYLLTVIDTAGICKAFLSKNINVVSQYNVKPDSIGLQCITGGMIRLSAPTPHNVSKPGGRWKGAGIINDSLGLWDPTVSGVGKFSIVYSVTGNSCASIDSSYLDIAGAPDPSILQPDSACSVNGIDPRHELKGRIPGGYFNGFGVDSVIGSSPTIRNYYIDGTKFNPTSTTPDTVSVFYRVLRGCWNDTIVKIPVVAPFNTAFLGVLSKGNPIYTDEFCATGGLDTLVVAGKGGTWRSLDFPQGLPINAIVDSKHGIFNPKVVNKGTGGYAYVEIGRAGFCGDTGRHRVAVMLPPEVKVLAENFCFPVPGDCVASNVPAADRKKSLKVRVAKSPYSKIDDSDPRSYVDVVTADKFQTGWSNMIESSVHTKWNGNPWMVFPYKFEAVLCQLQGGQYPISYTAAVSYRAGTNHPDSACYFTHDTAIFITDKLPLKLSAEGDLCITKLVTLTPNPVQSKLNYKWNDASTSPQLTTRIAGTYTVTVSSAYCSATDSITLSYCVGLEELENPISAQLFPNPSKDNIHLKMESTNEHITLSIFTMTGQLVEEFHFEPSNGKLDAEINISRLPAGVYSFAISNETETNTYRVVIE